ncbi:apolipoprotein N-acyltransferase [Thermomonospora echinospora]|uniref:Apolipoprotein N-acyltransferase n=1 Tax=Thermomonospora echinospora TaxID=1992 RepID=A0A1H6DJW9_9ACTN|nr:apolipoprotein N-acyltransferase [Thermomonospora echinospora]SEG84956.1 apolipoprotein N-acyltransferase [Thermomonospora echinospora]
MAHDTVPERQPADPAPPAPPERRRRAARPTGRWARLRTGGRAGWARTLAAVAGGLVMWPAFPPLDVWPLAPVGVALLTLALHGLGPRAAAWTAFWAGAAFFLPALSGIVKIGPDGWVLLSLVQAAYFAPMGAGIALAARLPGWPVWTAALWVAQEFVRGRAPFGGFPWARLVFSQTDSPLAPYAAVGGAPLVTFLTALAGGLLAYAVLRAPLPALLARRLPGAGRARGLRAPALALAGVLAVGAAGPLIPLPTDGRAVTVAVIQGNVPRLGLDFNSQRRAVLDNHVQRTHELAAQVREGRVARPELVVWPENSSDLDPYTDPQARALIDAAVKDIGVPVLVGAVIDAADGEHVENRGIVWDPRTGPGDHYVKRHPVPFGEYLPFREVLTKLITRFERIPRDFAKGERKGLLQLGPARIGDVICFEVAYDGLVRDVAEAELLVVQTNNATYGRTSLPPQQVAMSRLRAVEHGRSVLVAATSGISAIVAPDGRMLDRSAEFVPDIQVAAVPARTAPTLADRLGALPEGALALLGLAAAVAAVRAGSRTTEGA